MCDDINSIPDLGTAPCTSLNARNIYKCSYSDQKTKSTRLVKLLIMFPVMINEAASFAIVCIILRLFKLINGLSGA